MDKQSFISEIIANIKATVNEFSLDKLQTNGTLDYCEVKQDMYVYEQTLGDYARRAYGKRLLKRFIGFFTGTYYL